MREAPSIELINKLISKKVKVSAFDQLQPMKQKIFRGMPIQYKKNRYDCLKDADVFVIVTEWDIFKDIDIKKATKLMNNLIVFDGRNILSPKLIEKNDIEYYPIGKPAKSFICLSL